jgi:hypothetical protein
MLGWGGVDDCDVGEVTVQRLPPAQSSPRYGDVTFNASRIILSSVKRTIRYWEDIRLEWAISLIAGIHRDTPFHTVLAQHHVRSTCLAAPSYELWGYIRLGVIGLAAAFHQRPKVSLGTGHGARHPHC